MQLYDKLRNSLKETIDFWNQDVCDDDVLDFSRCVLQEEISKVDGFKLYRYMPAEYFDIRNVEKQMIHLSSNGVMNDIYEGSFISHDSPYAYEKWKKLSNIAYMSCMTENNDNLLMWSHYAASHTGICVEYDLKMLQDDPYDIVGHILPVIYESRRWIKKDINQLIEDIQLLNDAIEKDGDYFGSTELDDIIPLVALKSKVWEYEREWRVIYTRKQMYDLNDSVLYEGNIPFKCISAVYLGLRIHPEKRDNIIEICKRNSNTGNKISVCQAVMSEKTYEIKFEKII